MDEIIAGCARLPLALAIAAARAMLNHRFPLRSLADELRDERNRLDALDAGDHATNMRAVFSWSYQHLGTSAARMFRLMGLHPGPDISPAAAASLAGLPVDQIRGTLTELVRAHLINEHVPGRYTFHDLLRSYATEMTHIQDTDTERCAAVHRLLDHYLHTAHTAAELLSSRVDRISLVQPRPGAAAERLGTCADALAWFDAERAVMLAAVDHAARAGVQDPPSSWSYVRQAGPVRRRPRTARTGT